jgi:hypothetical protein
MAHALIDYLQTYGAPEAPIIPPVLEKPEEEEQIEEEPFLPEADPEQLQKEMADLENADPDELAFLSGLVNDETAPNEENTADVPDAVMTEELSEIFAQADELIDHELPQPPVAPDPVFVPMPEPIVLEDETEDTPEDIVVADASEAEVSANQAEQDVSEEVPGIDVPTEPATEETATSLPESKPIDPEAIPLEEKPFVSKIIAAAIVVVLLVGAWFFGQWYYNNRYLLEIDDIVLSCDKDTATVQVLSDVDEQLLVVICTDSYGNSTTSTLSAGVATFSNLNPNTRYTVRVEANGFHKLVGATTDSFTTVAETTVHSFTAGIGPEDRSVILNFSISGPETDNWTVLYSADGIAERSMNFTGRSVVVSDLVAGALYTFTLVSPDGLYMAGQTQVQFQATNILYAKDLTITACGGGRLTASWAQSADGTVTEWHVRCFNESGYNVTVTTTDLFYTFTGLDHSTSCTVEVTAEGMNQSVSTTISANPVTVESFACGFTQDLALEVTWTYSGQAPAGGWLLRYSINGGEESVLPLEDVISNILAVPGATYMFTIETAEGNFVFNSSHSFTATDIPIFSGYGITAADMTWSMFLWPDKELHDPNDIPAENYKTEFILGLQAGFVIALGTKTENYRNNVSIQFVLHDSQGNVLQQYSATSLWSDLWKDSYCLLPIPALAAIPGDYVLTVYFDGAFVHQQAYSVLEPIVDDVPQPEDGTI